MIREYLKVNDMIPDMMVLNSFNCSSNSQGLGFRFRVLCMDISSALSGTVGVGVH